jgi:NAD(P)H dehydrogenase (quinone)
MIVVTGANGRLGRLVVAGLLSRISASEVVAAVRSPEKAADLGVAVREADYSRPETLAAAFAGAQRVLLISGSEVGRRVPQHTAVSEAAKRAGVALLAYTSAPQADTTGLHVAAEHKATEQVIRASGVPFAFLRNGWYSENYTATIRQAAQDGSFYGSAGGGRVASAPISDYAAAAVEVLAGTGHEGAVYELSGDVAWTHDDLAGEISAVTGRPVTYQDLSPGAHREALLAAGLPEVAVGRALAGDASTAAGFLAVTSGQLRTLLGRPTVPIRDTIAAILGLA